MSTAHRTAREIVKCRGMLKALTCSFGHLSEDVGQLLHCLNSHMGLHNAASGHVEDFQSLSLVPYSRPFNDPFSLHLVLSRG